jgi:hypothetical protein
MQYELDRYLCFVFGDGCRGDFVDSALGSHITVAQKPRLISCASCWRVVLGCMRFDILLVLRVLDPVNLSRKADTK